MKLDTLLAVIEAGFAAEPVVKQLVTEATEFLSSDDKATVVQRLDAEADAARARAVEAD